MPAGREPAELRKPPMPSSPVQRTHTIAVLAVLAATAGIPAFLILRPGVVGQRPPGVVQPIEIKIAPEISGRLLHFAVAPDRAYARATHSPSCPTPSSKRD